MMILVAAVMVVVVVVAAVVVVRWWWVNIHIPPDAADQKCCVQCGKYGASRLYIIMSV